MKQLKVSYASVKQFNLFIGMCWKLHIPMAWTGWSIGQPLVNSHGGHQGYWPCSDERKAELTSGILSCNLMIVLPSWAVQHQVDHLDWIHSEWVAYSFGMVSFSFITKPLHKHVHVWKQWLLFRPLDLDLYEAFLWIIVNRVITNKWYHKR